LLGDVGLLGGESEGELGFLLGGEVLGELDFLLYGDLSFILGGELLGDLGFLLNGDLCLRGGESGCFLPLLGGESGDLFLLCCESIALILL